ncbi:MAG TPA: Dabb family protein [Phycisphaerae bacterium]|nr:Dabb family protein [Phycisphaerae bacterium]HPS53210.1 Dabb family protein [Phycisphaerae bacterium]
MIKHIVLWKLKQTADGSTAVENAQIMKERLEALNGRIPGMKKLEVGIDFSRTQASFDVALYSEFESRKALDDYQVHPEHMAVRKFIGGVIEGRHIADYEI